jgi:hypothetical protein
MLNPLSVDPGLVGGVSQRTVLLLAGAHAGDAAAPGADPRGGWDSPTLRAAVWSAAWAAAAEGRAGVRTGPAHPGVSTETTGEDLAAAVVFF